MTQDRTTMSAVDIYRVARSAGFSPEDAVTWTAIALAESGGRPWKNADGPEDSRGLWQIHVPAHGDRFGDLYDPMVNARAAFEISRGGTTMTPWTVTHAGRRDTSRGYRRWLDEARAAAADRRSSRPWTADEDTHTMTHASGDTIRGGVQPVPGHELVDGWGDPRPGGRRHEGIDIMAKEGTPVHAVIGGTVGDSFTNPLGGVVVRINGDDGRYYYYAHLKEGSVDHLEPRQPVKTGQVIGAVSDTGAARGTGHHLHLGIYEGGKQRHAVNPYPLLQGLPDPGVVGAVDDDPPSYETDEGDRITDLPPVDTDRDGLTDEMERLLGTSPARRDSDRDGLRDLKETTVTHTDPLSPDTDGDKASDAQEVAAGTDPGRDALPLRALKRGFAGGASLDWDRDGLSDDKEVQLGSNHKRADSDGDRVLDAQEVALGSDPTSVDSNDDGVTDTVAARLGILTGAQDLHEGVHSHAGGPGGDLADLADG